MQYSPPWRQELFVAISSPDPTIEAVQDKAGSQKFNFLKEFLRRSRMESFVRI